MKTLGKEPCGRNPWRASERQTLLKDGRRRKGQGIRKCKKKKEEKTERAGCR
jgi:hypothetical protein